METAASVLAVCVNYNGADVLAATLASLAVQDGASLDVLVVDCASTDGSATRLGPQAELLQLSDNAGYAAGLNAGLKRGLERPSYQWFLLLNNDVELASSALHHLLEVGRRQGPGVYGPKVVRQSDPSRLDRAWGEVTCSHVLARFRGQGAAADDQRWQEQRPVQLLLGCALLVHRKVLASVGLFDPTFFMYHEEVDFLFRCGQHQIPVVFCPQAVVSHRGAWSTRRQPLQKVFWVRRNTLRFLRKHPTSLPGWIHYWMTLAGSLIFNAALFRWRRTATIVRAVREGLQTL